MVRKIAHQVVVIACSGVLRRTSGDLHPLRKILMAPCRIPSLYRSRQPHAGSCRVERRAMPPARANQASDRENRGNGTRKLR
jgi:hypothetical protein